MEIYNNGKKLTGICARSEPQLYHERRHRLQRQDKRRECTGRDAASGMVHPTPAERHNSNQGGAGEAPGRKKETTTAGVTTPAGG